MQSYLPLVTVFVSGIFALLVTLASNFIAHRIEGRTHRRNRKIKRYEDIESLYVEVIANFEKCIRYTEQLMDYSEMFDALSQGNARLQLVSTEPILEQSRIASNVLGEWSSEYRQGAPKEIGDTGLSIVGTPDFPHQERAKALYPRVREEIIKLTRLMKEHLRAIERIIS